MFTGLFKVVLVVMLLGAVGAFFLGYRWAVPAPIQIEERTTGTSGRTSGIDQSRAREAGAEVGEKVAIGVNEAQRTLKNASVTARIKAKMTLDDSIEARRIDVDTTGSVVTLSGTVRSSSERSRALQLARETDGVTSVIDRLAVRQD